VTGWLGPARRLLLKARSGAQNLREAGSKRMKARRPTLPLEQVEQRLELLLMAIYGRPIPIVPVEARGGLLARMRRMFASDGRADESTPVADSEFIELSPALSAAHGTDEAIARYRLLAIEQGERVARGTAVHAPFADRLELDLYLIREGLAVDASIGQAHPGLGATLERERRAALARRPKLRKLTPAEREVERLYRNALSGTPGTVDGAPGDSQASRAWARETAPRIRAVGDGRGGGATYRGVPHAALWGMVRNSNTQTSADPKTDEEVATPSRHAPSRLGDGSAGERPEPSKDGSRDDSPGDNAIAEGEADDRSDNALARADGEVADEGARDEAADAGAHDPSSGTQSTIDGTTSTSDGVDDLPPGTSYDEWDCEAGAYLRAAATVRVYPPGDGDAIWSRDILRQHGAIARRIRREFEMLRARRALLRRQRAGDDLDVSACVEAIIDRRGGRTPDERLYMDARPARQGIAVSLLVDISGSTKTHVRDELRIIDLERIALLLAAEALDALGDDYAIQAFTGSGPSNVKLMMVKDFVDRNGATVRGRIAALEPAGFTRLGPVIRHATQHVSHHSAGHRLLLILSDGRPNDSDRYVGPYGVEDSRQAIMEARASGVFPFCLTVDRDASEYLPRIFGPAGYTILQSPERLPQALVRVVRTMVARA
jgi:nitric oxide reductase NorD protein